MAPSYVDQMKCIRNGISNRQLRTPERRHFDEFEVATGSIRTYYGAHITYRTRLIKLGPIWKLPGFDIVDLTSPNLRISSVYV